MKKIIAIDDGHGMLTAGKRTPVFTDGTIGETGNPWMHENEFNRAVAKYLKIHLERCGFNTLMVALGDDDVPRMTRINAANDAHADLYLSVHANALNGIWGPQEGVSAFHYPSSIEGKKAAEIIQKYLLEGTQQKDRKVQTALFDVLNYTDMPAVLVECAFMDNLREAKMLMNDTFRRECAYDIARGICEYFNVPYIKEESMKYQKLRKYSSCVHVVEMNPDKFRLDITEGVPGKLEKLSDMYGEPRLNEITWVRMNAQFFGGSTRGYGAFKDPTDDLPDKESSPSYTDLTYKNGKLTVGTLPAPFDFQIGTSYGIISNKEVNFTNLACFKALATVRNPRSMSGRLENGNNVFIVVDGRWKNFSLGVTMNQQAAIGKEIGAVELANFDGGGSSQLIIGDSIKNRPSDGRERAVISAIVGYRKYELSELPLLKTKSAGVYVNLAQRLLNSKGYSSGYADGKFGKLTFEATKRYQAANNLTVDGIIGAKTWTKLIVI